MIPPGMALQASPLAERPQPLFWQAPWRRAAGSVARLEHASLAIGREA